MAQQRNPDTVLERAIDFFRPLVEGSRNPLIYAVAMAGVYLVVAVGMLLDVLVWPIRAVTNAIIQRLNVPRAKHTGPPKFGEAILYFVCPPHLILEILGDFQEVYEHLLARRGIKFARVWYYWQVSRTTLAFLANVVERAVAAVNPFQAKSN